MFATFPKLYDIEDMLLVIVLAFVLGLTVAALLVANRSK